MHVRVAGKLEMVVRKHMEAITSSLAYASCSILLTLFNKAVFSGRHFDYPWFSLAWQNAVTAVLVALSAGCSLSGKLRWSTDLVRRMAMPNFFFVLFLFSNSRSLRYMTLPVQVVFKSLAPVGITIFESMWHGDRIAPGTWVAMILCIAGNVVAALGRGGISFSIRGYLWAFVNLIANVAYLATLRTNVPPKYSSSARTFASAVLSLFWMIPLAGISGELTSGNKLNPRVASRPSSVATRRDTFMEPTGRVLQPSAIVALAHESTQFLVTFLLSGILGTLISAASFWCVSATSGSTFSIVGSLNKIPVSVLGYLIFREPTTVFTWIGVLLSLIAGLVFTESKRRTYMNEAKTATESAVLKTTPMNGGGHGGGLPRRCN
ncbi:GDP-mannose transporter into the lumen of the Golgi [Cyanidiococcus yangmingshanensis]|uniref:GDP-mannose transporter into the lumen of the Golgi n=1 Tax=Cyanidiococcus yangmingshanensis TaxID=2690220 RepID=A0A7J7IEF0_9RHOD|nr:GDP-mannose transporter into the lumen of the Golgi [Cyanidiococcus yangmingshanensis]